MLFRSAFPASTVKTSAAAEGAIVLKKRAAETAIDSRVKPETTLSVAGIGDKNFNILWFRAETALFAQMKTILICLMRQIYRSTL